MKTIIITDDIRNSEFIRKGLSYENINSEIHSIDNLENLKNYVSFFNGIFIFTNNQDKISKFIDLYNDLNFKLPIILLTNHVFPDFKYKKYNQYIKKIFIRPFSFTNIAEDMRYFIFEVEKDEIDNVLVIRDLELNLYTHEAKVRETPIRLRHKEFALLYYLMINKGKVVNRTSILEHVWDRNACMSTNTIDVHISQLRKKISLLSSDKYIHTIPCTGYILH